MEKETEFLIPSFEDIDRMITELVKMIKADHFQADILIGISRGGLIPAAMLSKRLNIESEIIGVEYYTGVKKTMKKPKITRYLISELKDKKILIVDDVADKGHSLKIVIEYVKKQKAGEIRVCTIHYKPWSVVKPDYFVEETKAWIIYPWEIQETLKDLLNNLIDKGLTEREARLSIEKKGIPKEIIEEYLD